MKTRLLSCTIRFTLLPILALSLVGGAPLHAQDATADLAKLIEQLDKLEEGLSAAKNKNNASAVVALTAAMGNDGKALELYFDCMHEIEFKEKGRKESEFRDWREGPGKKMREAGVARALRLQCAYLLLSIKAGSAKTDADRAELVTGLGNYLNDLVASTKDLASARGPLNESVLKSAYARHFKLDVSLKTTVPWSERAGSVGEIYEKSILPMLREKKDLAGLSAAWTKRITQEGMVAAADSNDVAEKNFKEKHLPGLQWGQAKDAFTYGTNKGAAGTAMLRLIQENAARFDTTGWINELRQLLLGKPAAAEETADAPAPEAAK